MARPGSRQQAQVERLLASFLRKRRDGRACYPIEDRKRLVQLLLVTLIPPARYPHLPLRLKRMLGLLSIAAKTRAASSSQETMRALQAYFQRNPPSPAILRDFNDALRKLTREADAHARESQTAEDPGKRSGMSRPPPPKRIEPRSAPPAPGRTSALDSLLSPTLRDDAKAALDKMMAFRNVR